MSGFKVFQEMNSELCTGCEACIASCPVSCISMNEDEEGFKYPIINNENECVGCGKCVRVCPVLNSEKNHKISSRNIYAGYCKDEGILKSSASGGMFTVIANAFVNQHKNSFRICGVSWSVDFKGAEHIIIDSLEEIHKLRGSKYIQSTLSSGAIYRNIKSLLDDGVYVLFSGTPCQVAALQNYLGKEYDNLLKIDIICQGPSSPKAMREFVDWITHKYNASIKSLNMRYVKVEPWIPQWLLVEFDNGKHYCKPFYETIIGRSVHLMQRKSCYQCKFIGDNKYSDITIGDYHGARPNAKYYNASGTSLLIFNTEKGKKIIQSLTEKQVILEIQNYNEVAKTNPRLNGVWAQSPKRKAFSDDFCKNGLEYAAKSSWTYKERIKFNLPYCVRTLITKIRPGGKRK